MDPSSVYWLQELENEVSNLIHQSNMNPPDQINPQQLAATLEADFRDSLSLEDYASYFGSPGSTRLNCSTMEGHTNTIGGAVEAKDEMKIIIPHGKEWNFESPTSQGPDRANMGSSSLPNIAQDHANAERKRREKLNQLFIALSAIIPGLKKTDKASLIEGAIAYLKHLESKVKILEEEAVKTVESLVVAEKPQPSADDRIHISSSDVPLVKIETRLAENNILIRIHCEKRKGILAKVISEIEKLHLTIMNANAMPFASSSLAITVAAKIEDGISMTLKDFEENLKSAFSKFM